MTRRGSPAWLGLVAAGAVLCVVAASCSAAEEDGEVTSSVTSTSSPESSSTVPNTTTSPETTTSAALATEPTHGGVVKVGVSADLVHGYTDIDGQQVDATMNPLLRGNDAPEIARLVVPGAFRLDAKSGELTPWLVDQIPRPDNGGVVVADDGTVRVGYRVREEAVWEDGTPVTARDLAFTHDLIIRLGDGLRGDGLMRAHELIDSASIVADGKVFAAELTHPDPAYEMLFEWVLPAHLIDPDTFTQDWNDRLWPSAGPFRFVSSELAAFGSSDPSIVVVERNPSYWEADPETGALLPYLDRIEVHAFFLGTMNPGAIATWVRSGSVDAVLAGLFREFDQGYLEDFDELGVTLVAEWDTLFEVLAFNLGEERFEINPDSHNDQLLYRQAVLAAIDRVALGETVSTKPVNSILGIAVDGYDHDAWAAYDDVSRAEGLLSDVEGTPMAVYVTSNGDETIRIGDAVIEQLNQAGIQATGDYEGDFFGIQLPQRRLDLYAFRTFAGEGGLSGVAHMLSVLDPNNEAAFWSQLTDSVARYRDVVAAAQSEVDQERLALLIQEAESILADNAVIYPLVRRQPSYRAFWPNRIQGIIPNRTQGWDTWNAATWWSPTG